MRLQQIIEQQWYQKTDPFLTIILFPFTFIYGLVITFRQLFFKLGIMHISKLSVPVVVIGNITVGGAGKTPLTKYLAQTLNAEGLEVGVILRGYKSTNKQARIVNANDNSNEVGDEALIYAKAGFKVAIGPKRVDAGKLLLKTFPEIKLILADDGMQHYYLKRDMEICVIDSFRLFGNQQLLPMGPLREAISRLKKVDYIVVNGRENQKELEKILNKYQQHAIYQSLEFKGFFNPVTCETLPAAGLNDRNLLVMAGIGNPLRFYSYLKNLGVKFTEVKSFPDHYDFQENDIPNGYTIITTEKDYTKLAKFKNKIIWIAQVAAQLDNATIINEIKNLVYTQT